MAEGPNAREAAFWNAEPGERWVRHEADLDAISAGVLERLLAAAAPAAGERVLDVGCGAGASSFAFGAAVGPAGRVLGVDISVPLVRRAEARRDALGMRHVGFVVADAQVHPFEAGGFDLVASRFGMMFFDDTAAALANLRTALRPGGRIVFVAWTGPEENPWFAWPHRIAVARLGPVAPVPEDAPGPMAFRAAGRVCGLLERAGFRGARAEAVAVDLHHPGGLEAVVRLMTEVGPVARVLREKAGTEADRAAIAAELAEAFGRFRSEDGIRIPARVTVFWAER